MNHTCLYYGHTIEIIERVYPAFHYAGDYMIRHESTITCTRCGEVTTRMSHSAPRLSRPTPKPPQNATRAQIKKCLNNFIDELKRLCR